MSLAKFITICVTTLFIKIDPFASSTTYTSGADLNNAAIPRLDVIQIGSAGGFSGYTAPLANTSTIGINLAQSGTTGTLNSTLCGTAALSDTVKLLEISGDATNFDVVCGTASGYQLPTPPAHCFIRFLLTTGPSNPCEWFQASIPATCCVYIQPGSADPQLTSGILGIACNLIIGSATQGLNGGISISAAVATVNSIISNYSAGQHPILTLNSNTTFANAVNGISLSGAFAATFNTTSNIVSPTLSGANKISELIVGTGVTLTVNSAGAVTALPITLSSATSRINISGSTP